MRRPKNRKGIFVVLFGILFMSLMGAAAISIDFARIWAMRNELQTTADAAALAGAVQIGLTPTDSLQISNAARNYASRNLAMGVTSQVDSVVLGHWTDIPPSGVDNFQRVKPFDAVQTFVSHSTNRLIMGALGITAPTVHANATSWANAPVQESGCIKPWSIPYQVLMAQINTHRGIANNATSLTRTFDNDLDMRALREMTDLERTFTLKQGSQGSNDPYPDGSTAPGNFQRVQIPKYWDAATNTKNPEGTSNGTADYKDAISGAVCHTLSIGDSLQTLPGNAPEPTLDAIVPNVCASLVNDKTSPNNGNCINAQGGVGVDIKAAFHQCLSNCNGMQFVQVKMLGSFTLTKVYPNKDTGSNPLWDTGQIQGTFKPVSADGAVGTGPSMYYKIILVR